VQEQGEGEAREEGRQREAREEGGDREERGARNLENAREEEYFALTKASQSCTFNLTAVNLTVINLTVIILSEPKRRSGDEIL
jgi:hypothetical protein